ncbi:IS110 family transposase, partial [Paraburkholderia sp. JHI869]|uniref:IS110 family transposase n=1 Tax=Paraburkholderia sp. JHI869 TaxID=3112959 RepID=UPI0031793929
MSVALLSIDLAKNIFQLYGVDERGHPVLSRRVSRNKLLEAVVCLPSCRIVMEACGGAHYWARRFSAMGHQVQIIAPRFVKPFVKSQKNDRNDAEAIVEAASRPTMRYVAVNSVEQQDIQSMHRVRSLLMRDRIAQINQIRGLLAEYGVVIAQTPLKVRTQLPAIIDDEHNELTGLTRTMMRDMYERLALLDRQIARYDNLIQQVHEASPTSQRLEKIRGVGPMIATGVIAAAGSASEFSNGRQFAAWLGLTPRQHSSGG